MKKLRAYKIKYHPVFVGHKRLRELTRVDNIRMTTDPEIYKTFQ